MTEMFISSARIANVTITMELVQAIRGKRRDAHCHLENYSGSRQYSILYPYELEASGQYSYKIDKVSAKFGADGIELVRSQELRVKGK